MVIGNPVILEQSHAHNAPDLWDRGSMMESQVVKPLLYGCVTWTSLKGSYSKLHTAQTQNGASSPRSLVQVAELPHSLLRKTPSSILDVTLSKQPCAWGGYCGRGAAPHGRPQVTHEGHVGRTGERGIMWAKGKRERLDGLRVKGSLGVWHHEGLDYRRTRL